ncbi:MAG: hypothetical protein K0S25_1408 [Bacillus sp. (in: firmicutes)]|jgi:EAL domain-containing protein (putative c-di-GMP-specific phosphodiesterase class I)|nr:hypothetical protein [Bacillus sp. (in: firmicutes)]
MQNTFLPNLSNSGLFTAFRYLHRERKKRYMDYKRFLELDKIIRNQSLTTFFQPILDLENGKTIGYEVLNRPPSTSLFPNTDLFYEFIGQTDRVFQFECFIRNISIKRLVDGLGKSPNQKSALVFLNIHPYVLMDSNYKIGETKQLIEEYGISPEQVVFEITEKQAVSDFVQFERILSHYRSQGFRIAVDGAGSGYNSLKTLVYLKPEFIKLDKSIIQNINKTVVKQKMVSLLMNFAVESDTSIIAEGIEQVKDYQYLRKIGIHFGQGYGLGTPKKELTPGSLIV